MSEPIQSISQSNYILHNIDAKKLYVQEPLFTANSGDAVYVGWRPDETVLYSGQATGNLTLSDNPLNYERLLVTFNASTGNTDMGAGSEIFEPDKTHLVCLHNYFMYQTTQTAFNNMNEAWAVYSGVDTTAWTRTIGGWRNGSTYTSNLNNSNDFLKVSKVIGINRKENA